MGQTSFMYVLDWLENVYPAQNLRSSGEESGKMLGMEGREKNE